MKTKRRKKYRSKYRVSTPRKTKGANLKAKFQSNQRGGAYSWAPPEGKHEKIPNKAESARECSRAFHADNPRILQRWRLQHTA
ncbi:MAG: hypothetical protein A2664_03410 [Candidatus Taylorbacteria bacterium RIFCSPHIGHO2_01_FULL_46_22b]|uniref:Uncharacterized protein n=1 Tax=Candidatus Taylorbacteria bacterium RIFCSPHIGHO2_01_FULL_46_22b TaxID=1802301 RepID=A0A1G2M3L7_9BACT|nr:MAG: hypothetical protein A2664_03410 [Candidatus Taylorbacteria bacterium RIFCSPHIGHO2_01_FULL_46_22b]